MASRFHVKKGDLVVVLNGEEKGKRGKVLEVKPKSNRVVVEGLNMMKKHLRKSQKDPQGGIVTREGTIHLSSVMKAESFDSRAGKRKK